MTRSKKTTPEEPTKAELEILQVLWDFGPAPVRLVNDYLNEHVRTVLYTSTLKIMQLMLEKGLLYRDERQMQHIYSAAVKETKMKRFLLSRFVDTHYKGSSTSLMLQLLGAQKAPRKELEKIKELLLNLTKK